MDGYEVQAITKTRSKGEWPQEPTGLCDFPVLRAGQPYEDWLKSHDNWMASLSPRAAAEVTTFRSEVRVYLRARAWKLRRKSCLDAFVVAASTILLGSALGLFDDSWFEAVRVFWRQAAW